MAIINNNVQNVKFLRNLNPFESREAARTALENNKGIAEDGTSLLARYSVEESGATVIKTIVGYVAVVGTTHHLTIIDVEGASGDVEELRREINAKLGSGITSTNTATAQLAALSGGTFVPGTSSSADTSVEGAKAYAYDLIGTLDHTDTAETGNYVSKVDQVDGIISVTRVALPSSADTAVAKKVVIAVSEDKGQIEVTRGEISSSAETMVLTDNTDGGVNFEVNIDNNTIIQDAETKKLKVADAALVQYEGDTKTIAISPVQDGVRTVSSIITLSSITPSSTTVKEEYALKNASGETIGSTIKIYKDSSIVEINYITDPADEHYQNLEYIYIDASGNTQTEYVDMSSLVLEAEFASGLTIENHVARGVVDPQSELDSEDTAFLTVGANGFKISGIKDEIDRQLDTVVEGLDANVSGNSTHVTVGVEEVDGVITAVTVSEDNIANADDLATLSAKTITDIDSANDSITVTPANAADGTQEIDLATDASKIQMSGFTTDNSKVFSGISESDSIADAFKKADTVVTGIRRDVDTVSGDVETIKDQYISGVSVNGSAVTVANNVAPISVEGATSAMTATSTEAIVVNTDANGNITLGLASIDCGTY